VEDNAVTDAAVHDSQVVEELLEEGADAEVYADSAYRSAEASAMLKGKGIGNRVHECAYRNRPLTAKQKTGDTSKSRVSARVEHVFAFQGGVMGADWIRTVGGERAGRGIGLTNLVYNLFRFCQMKCTMA
jgi:IS5 family transposase